MDKFKTDDEQLDEELLKSMRLQIFMKEKYNISTRECSDSQMVEKLRQYIDGKIREKK